MHFEKKDYYKILELAPSANMQEIKTAYRRLAHQYHPDKNHNDHYAAAQFEIIKEAYEVLTDPSRKAYYLQQRWYDQSMNIKRTQHAVTPVTVLKQVLELERYVSKMDIYRMDREGLFSYISAILDDDTIKRLNGFHDPSVNATIIDTVLKASAHLDHHQVLDITRKLMSLESPMSTQESILEFERKSKRNKKWNRHREWLVLAIVLLLCLLISYLSG
ncbi:MAG: J domain-containing protein [Chitinophagaceae bacterium]|nr:J domain-containing protein [Chitinophagaceae bacterium]